MRQTVRTRCNGEYPDIGIKDCLGKNLFQVFDRCIRICKCLEIGNIGMNRSFRLKSRFSGSKLFADTERGRSGKVARSHATTEDTAAPANLSIPVGAGHPPV